MWIEQQLHGRFKRGGGGRIGQDIFESTMETYYIQKSCFPHQPHMTISEIVV